MINVIYEDNHILVVEKPINVPVQEDDSNDKDLLSILKGYLKEKYHKPGNAYLGLVHRLDRPVGGVMVFAKTSKAASRLSEEIRNNNMDKIYCAVVLGTAKNSDHLEDYLLKDTSTNITKVDNNGKLAILDYKLINTVENLSMVEIKLKTGRSHQIRVQLSSRNLPIFGDQKYNKSAKVGEQLALFAKKLVFKHPVTGEILTFELSLPNKYPFNIFKSNS